MRSEADRLRDILDAIGKIEERRCDGLDEFLRDELLQVWVIHHLEIIGEATRGLPAGFRDSHPEFPWAQLTGMRNILIHEYFGIDLQQVWQVVVKDLPQLKRRVQALSGGLS